MKPADQSMFKTIVEDADQCVSIFFLLYIRTIQQLTDKEPLFVRVPK